MLRRVTVARQFMIELKGAVSEEARARTITKLVLLNMGQNVQYDS
jgi:hypothetical protein